MLFWYGYTHALQIIIIIIMEFTHCFLVSHMLVLFPSFVEMGIALHGKKNHCTYIYMYKSLFQRYPQALI